MQILGLSDSTPKPASRILELVWPRIDSDIAAIPAATNAMYACFLVAAVNAFLGLLGSASPSFWVDVFTYGFLGVGVRQLSRAATILAFVFYGLSWLVVPAQMASVGGYFATVAAGMLSISGMIRLIITLSLFHGIRAATFIHSEHQRNAIEVLANAPGATVAVAASAGPLERLPGRLWPILRVPFFAALILVVTVNLMLWSASTFVQQWTLPTSSMEKTLFEGEHVVSMRSIFMGQIERGDLIVFRYPVDPEEVLVKRVVGIPGDQIRIANKQLFVNGVKAEERYVGHTTGYIDNYRDQFPSQPSGNASKLAIAMLRDQVHGGEVVVPAGRFFVLGDNRDASLDSRYWGFVPQNYVLGRPVLITYSSHPSRTMTWLKRFPLRAAKDRRSD